MGVLFQGCTFRSLHYEGLEVPGLRQHFLITFDVFLQYQQNNVKALPYIHGTPKHDAPVMYWVPVAFAQTQLISRINGQTALDELIVHMNIWLTEVGCIPS